MKILTDEQKQKLAESRRRWYERNQEKVKESRRRWQKENSEKHKVSVRRWQKKNAERIRSNRRKRLYGVSSELFLEMRKKQDDLCAICKLKTQDFYVDHDHVTGAVRELLCLKCNSGLGMFRDDFSVLIRAADYVRRHKKKV